MQERGLVFGLVALLLFWSTFHFGVETVEAARISDVRGTKHNLSAAKPTDTYTIRTPTAARPCTVDDPCTGTPPARTMQATVETQVCVFCHTPHAATSGAVPLWNRQISATSSYTVYSSSSLDATRVSGEPAELAQPGGSSKLCLSCHDGTVAIGSVNVYNGKGGDPANPQTIVTTTGDNSGKMPLGTKAAEGFTRNLGVDLRNDHPISMTYNADVAARDGELVTPSPSTQAWVRSTGVKPVLPLEKTGSSQQQMQCATCHDPHIRDTNPTFGAFQKFLRLNRFQQAAPTVPASFSQANDIICLACHDKNSKRNDDGTRTITSGWAVSAHANPAVANETYSAGVASTTDRDFPGGLQVYQAACLNCHDTHTADGAKRLLRAGASAGTQSQETVCYQCHAGGENTVTLGAPGDSTTNPVPNIKADFAKTYKMPIGGTEVHDIAANFNDSTDPLGGPKCDGDGKTAANRNTCGADLIESRAKLNSRHAECTDCHNPHRVIRNDAGLPGGLTNANTVKDRVNGASGAAHKHLDDNTVTHTNVISGALRGNWGVQPDYGTATSFQTPPASFKVVRGDPGAAAVSTCNWTVSSTTITTPTWTSANRDNCNASSVTYVTREYQICLKCHSNYAYGSNPPVTGPSIGKMDLQKYTNQAQEFHAPDTHRGEVSASNTGASATYDGATKNNHRSWHPVIDSTGRTAGIRRITGNNPWRAPWSNAVGTQTMYCTDCHGSDTAATTVIPTGTNPWGPHGSENPFLLKGAWEDATGGTANLLCFKCHNANDYNSSTDQGRTSGFYGGGKGNLHNYHRNRIGRSLRCTWCHVAVPHGWKNKALLVNLSDVGPEVGLAVGTAISDSAIVGSNGYTKGPYYYKAYNKIKTFAVSGNWTIGDCGNGDSDKWMRSNTDASRGEGICKNPQ